MNFIHLHLMLNHLPLAGAAFGLALLQWGLRRGSGELQKTALAVFVLNAVLSVVVFATGDEAAELALKIPGWPQALIEAHERAAQAALVAAAALGAVSVWGLRQARGQEIPSRRAASWAAWLAVLCLSILAWASYRGGLIRHSEIQPDWKEWR